MNSKALLGIGLIGLGAFALGLGMAIGQPIVWLLGAGCVAIGAIVLQPQAE